MLTHSCQGPNQAWVIDSGANQHMSLSDRNMFDLIDVSSYNITVGHPNGTEAKAESIGKLKLLRNVVLIVTTSQNFHYLFQKGTLRNPNWNPQIVRCDSK
ncbi:hypothetical protein HanIR_Chr06g0277241 [Helianthus annuus]|nr:hypothetical protein HanIR_Chr06g0277241 [Helianthus annuus]